MFSQTNKNYITTSNFYAISCDHKTLLTISKNHFIFCVYHFCQLPPNFTSNRLSQIIDSIISKTNCEMKKINVLKRFQSRVLWVCFLNKIRYFFNKKKNWICKYLGANLFSFQNHLVSIYIV